MNSYTLFRRTDLPESPAVYSININALLLLHVTQKIRPYRADDKTLMFKSKKIKNINVLTQKSRYVRGVYERE